MNPAAVQYVDPIVKKHLEVTYSIMVYQEQGMQLARDMAGFDHNEVDKLRKAISKKNDKLFAEVTNLFKTKAIARGVEEKAVDSVLNFLFCLAPCCQIYMNMLGWTSTLLCS